MSRRASYRPLPPQADPLLNIVEFARALRVSKRTVQRWVRRGLVPQPIRLSPQKLLWRESDIRKFLDARAADTAGAGQGATAEAVNVV